MKKKRTVLTPEERDILILTSLHPSGKHLSNSEIGQRLGVSVTKVKTLMHQACVKLGAHNRNEAVYFAIRRGEIDLDELFSLDELAEILSSLGPDMLRGIAHLVRQEQEQGHGPVNVEPPIRTDREKDGILTNRERDVLILASSGLTNKEIADRLCISASAVRTFFNRASTKLGARKRADAVQSALKQREISVGEISSLDDLLQELAPLGPEAIEQIAQLLDDQLGKASL